MKNEAASSIAKATTYLKAKHLKLDLINIEPRNYFHLLITRHMFTRKIYIAPASSTISTA